MFLCLSFARFFFFFFTLQTHEGSDGLSCTLSFFRSSFLCLLACLISLCLFVLGFLCVSLFVFCLGSLFFSNYKHRMDRTVELHALIPRFQYPSSSQGYQTADVYLAYVLNEPGMLLK